MAIDRYSDRVDPIVLSALQFLTVGILSLFPALILEKPDFSSLLAAWLPILYAGVLSSGVAYTLQVIAQKFTSPVVASISMSFESAFALLGAALILNEKLTLREWLGCAVMFAAVIITQLPQRKKKR